MSRLKEQRILVGLVLAFAILIIVELLLLLSVSAQRRAAGRVAVTRDRLEKMKDLITYLGEAETGRRGYVLSGQDQFLGHHTNRLGFVHLTLRELRQLATNSARYTEVCDRLEALVFQRLKISSNSIRARQAGGLPVPDQVSFMEEGQRAMQPIREIVQQMTAEETAILQARRAKEKKNSDGTNGLALLATLVGLVLFAALLILFARANRQRRRAEEALQQSNAELERRVQQRTAELSQTVEKSVWLASFPENNPNPVIELDLASGGVFYANPYATRLFPDLLSLGVRHPFLAGVPEAAQRLLKGGPGPVRREVVLHESCYSQSINYIPEIRRLRIYSSDITERKQAEEALRRSEERFRTLTESLPQLVWTCRPDGYCDYLSRQWVQYTGRPAEEQLGSGWAQQLHPDDRERVQREWAKAFTRGGDFDIEFRIRRADGVYRWFKTRAAPLRAASGEIIKWFGSNTDFEDFKRSEQKLQTQLGRLDLLQQITRAIGERQDLASIFRVVVGRLEDNLPVDFGCVCLYEPAAGTLTVVSVGGRSEPLARELAMTPQAKVAIDENGLSRCVRGELLHEPDLTRLPLAFPQRLVQAGLRSLVAAPLSVEGKVFGVLLTARRAACSFESGECEFLRQLCQHVALAAHQAQLYGALQQAYDELRQTQQSVLQQERLRSLGQMASGVAHDINNAISPAALYTESLLEKEPNLSARARDYLQTIRQAIHDVAETIARMREFYRQREPQLLLTPVRLNALIPAVVELTRARWQDMPQQNGTVIRIATELAPDLPDILGVESELREALTNLIFNAIDAMPRGGTLTLRTGVTRGAPGSDGAPDTARVYVETADSGVGMDEDTRRRCLEPFFTTKGERGTGLGLSMVFGAVQRHGAELAIESAPEQGTTVRITFAVPATIAAEPVRSSDPVATPSGLRILVVDDDPLLLKSLRDTLETDDHIIVTAGGGQEGIDLFRASRRSDEPFAVVITDLGMPHVDGRQVAKEVKAATPTTPVILLTGWGQRLMVEGEIPADVDRVLSKPPKLRELREALFHCCPSLRP